MNESSLARLLRSGVFEVDLRRGELRKQGLKVKLQGQPIQVLVMLLERLGEVVTREEIQKRLWPADTFVDFEHGVNTAVKKLREALGDDADNPRFVETLHRRGYRFIAPVEVGAHGVRPDVGAIHESPLQATGAGAQQAAPLQLPQTQKAGLRYTITVAGVAVAAVAALLLGLNVGGLRDQLRSRAAVPRIESLAVLPLENLSRDPEQEYFADGMAEALITELAQISALRVISRTSVMQYKGARKPLPEIARELNVDAVVEGAVLRSGDRVRITAQLLHARADRHLWTEIYERDLRDVLTLQADVARAVANEIQLKLTPQEQTHLASARPVNPEAYEALLRGGLYREKLTEAGTRKAIEYYQQAINKDLTFAPAYARLAGAYGFSASAGYVAPKEALPKAKAAAMRALELDDTLAEAHVMLCVSKFCFEWDWSGAERELKRALELNPNSFDAHQAYSEYLTQMGRFEEAIEEDKLAFSLNPTSRIFGFHLGWTYSYARRYDDAIRELQKQLEVTSRPSLCTCGWRSAITLRG